MSTPRRFNPWSIVYLAIVLGVILLLGGREW
jgi:hypothetical protein